MRLSRIRGSSATGGESRPSSLTPSVCWNSRRSTVTSPHRHSIDCSRIIVGSWQALADELSLRAPYTPLIRNGACTQADVTGLGAILAESAAPRKSANDVVIYGLTPNTSPISFSPRGPTSATATPATVSASRWQVKPQRQEPLAIQNEELSLSKRQHPVVREPSSLAHRVIFL